MLIQLNSISYRVNVNHLFARNLWYVQKFMTRLSNFYKKLSKFNKDIIIEVDVFYETR